VELGTFDVDGGHLTIRYDNAARILAGVEFAARMIDVGRALRDRHGADVLVMGCAGMALYRADLEEAVQIPVIEPTQAAVAMAIGRLQLGWGASSARR
jgi:allantoin racemase